MNSLKFIEEQTKMTKTQLAQILGISKSNYSDLYSDIEKGKVLSIKHAIKLANHFHISLDQIYNDYITPEEREQGVIDFTQIVVNAGEYEIISIYRAIGEKIGKGGQEAYREFGNTLLENLK